MTAVETILVSHRLTLASRCGVELYVSLQIAIL
jgi:hypothetical protein